MSFFVFVILSLSTSLGFSQGAEIVVTATKIPPQVMNTAPIEIKPDIGGLEATVSAQIEAALGPASHPLTADCLAAAKSANFLCNTSTSPTIVQATAAAGLALSTISVVNGLSNACSKFNSIMTMANGALAAYNGYCGIKVMSCHSTCTKALANVSAAGVTPPPSPAVISSVQKLITGCNSYKLNLAAAGVGLVSTLTGSGIGKKCTKESNNSDCAQNPDLPACKGKEVTALRLDCALAENQNTPACICRMNPRSPGCEGFKGSDYGSNYSRIVPGSRNSNFASGSSNGDGGTSLGASGSEDTSAAGGGAGLEKASGSGSGANAAAAGAGGGSGTSGSDGGAAVAEKSKSAELSGDILEGYEGGGGGGGGSRGRSVASSGISDSSYKAYGSFLPGEENDRKKLDAAEIPVQDQVTGGGGISNFDKVRIQYQNQSGSLLGR